MLVLGWVTAWEYMVLWTIFFAGKTRTEAGREELRHPVLVLDHVIDLVYLITNLPAWPNG